MMSGKIMSVQRPENGRLEVRIKATPSKSETNRALIIGAISPRPFTVGNPSLSDDSNVLVEVLNKVGIKTELTTEGFVVSGTVLHSVFDDVEVNLKSSGSALRFFLPIAIFLRGNTTIDCDEQLRRRPIKSLVDTLRNVGATIEYLKNENELPIKVYGKTEISEANFTVDVSQTSQMLSGIMLLAPMLEPLTRVYFNRSRIISQSYAELTQKILQSVGIEWKWKTACYELDRNKILNDRYNVGGDWSSASYWFGLASTINADLFIENLSSKSFQGDVELKNIFQKWKIDIIESENGIHLINIRNNVVKPFDIDFGNMPDVAPTFSVLATFADGTSTLRGLGSLVHKESNRIEAMAVELQKLNQGTKTTPDLLKITSQPMLQIEPVDVHEDHRLAMSFMMLSNRLDCIEIGNPDVVEKSYPNFWDDISNAGYRLRLKQN